ERHAVDYRPSVSGDYFIKNPTLPHPHEVCRHVFQSFKGNQGNLRDTLHADVRALLALYEAAHLGTPKEQFLIKAQKQTISLLTSVVDHLERPLAKKARLYIPLYEEDKEECNELVLELAKIYFYFVQRIHREEVREISNMWYHGLESPRKLFYARHRPTEAYVWALGVYYEPQYVKARKLLAKFIATITPYDDTFDNYGIWEELEPFANVMQRWNMKDDVEQLRECYRDYAHFMFSTMIEIENALPEDVARRNVDTIRDIINEVCKGYVVEIGWRDNNYIPSLEEHLNNITEEILKWMSNFPQIVKGSCIVSRLMDDIVAHA
uniref:Terpene synthase metal-binding domain-containing protein n=1 Tax=Setaria italica TaxID=4555 RepID=K4AMF5_SETIT